MTITIDMDNTLASQLAAIKEKIQDFKSLFTENDLLRMYTETTGEDIDGEILKCKVDAFASNSFTTNSSFYIEIIVDDVTEFHRVSFFVDEDGDTFSICGNENLLVHFKYQ